MKILIFHARAWSFADKATGRQIDGNAVSYLEDMLPVVEPNERGLAPMQIEALDEAFAQVVAADLPALFDVELKRRAGSKGKPATFLTGAKFLRSVPVETLLGAVK